MRGNQGAYYWNATREARDRIQSDPTLSLYERSRLLDQMETVRQDSRGKIPFGSMAKTLYDGGMPAGAAFLGSRLLGLPKPVQAGLAATGFGLGTLWSRGMQKLSSSESEAQEHAFRLGFLQAAKEAGYFEKDAAAAIMVDPSNVFAPVGAARDAGKGFISGAGSIAGAAVAPTLKEEEIAKLEAEEAELLSKLKRLQRKHDQRQLQQILRSRR